MTEKAYGVTTTWKCKCVYSDEQFDIKCNIVFMFTVIYLESNESV